MAPSLPIIAVIFLTRRSWLPHSFSLEWRQDIADEQNGEQEIIVKIVVEIEKRLQGKSPLLIALDGRSGTGKSTLAQALTRHVEGCIVVGDDFYAGGNDDVWSGLSAEEKVARVIDWQRMRSQVLEPLLAGKTARWHPLAFEPEIGWVGWQDAWVTLEPAPVIILDGVYSARPELRDLVDLAILIEADDAERRQRLIRREGQAFMARWHQIWDAAEDYYFSTVCSRASFDMVIREGADS